MTILSFFRPPEPAGPEEISALGLLLAFAAIFFTMRLALRLRQPTAEETRLVLAGIAAGEAEARLWAGALETRGIRATLRTLGGAVMPMLTHYELWVDTDDRERARELLGLTAAAARKPARPRAKDLSGATKQEPIC